jgi:hypothetical protein
MSPLDLYFSENALYYTLSTIAQTLAAGFGIVAAFVLFRLPQIEQAITKAQVTFEGYKTYIEPEEMWLILKREGTAGLQRRLKDIQEEKNVTFDDLVTLYEQIEDLEFWLPTWSTVHRNLKITVVLTAFDVALCLIALPSVPLFLAHFDKSIVIIGTTVILAVVCIALYCFFILALISPGKIIRGVRL